MISTKLDFKGANQYLPYIFLVGVGIGTTNYIIHRDFNWFQWVVMSTLTSFIVGFTLLLISSNKAIIKQYLHQKWKLYSVLLIVFFLIGIIATEIESLIKTVIFQAGVYLPFSSNNLYVPNSIISIFLGFSFFSE